MYKKPKHSKGIRFFPTFIMEDLLVILMSMILLTTVVFYFPELIFPESAEEPADPFNTPEHIKPEWYFLASYQLLKIIPSKIGALAFEALIILVVVCLPFIDRGPNRHILRRPFFLTIVLLSIAAFIGLTVWGAVS